MLLHLGGDRSVSADEIIAILDVRLWGGNTASAGASNGDEVKAAILTDAGHGTEVLYSPLSPRTLYKRVNTDMIL